MSTIGPDSRIDRTGLDSQAALESLRSREPAAQDPIQHANAVSEAVPAYAPPAVDAGEDVLNADAWHGVPPGERLLAGDSRLEHELGSLDLSAAADRGADAVMDSFTV
ncbi:MULTISPECIES: hypothetical protein [Lysobacter]|jgi:hypothetical protein|uniref:Uncharacterized protein n=1 Tax=Lysobacter gummosus TaxID=262324 RepID=A0ABY3XE04_9GAMM|nr:MULTISPECIES: hypothetical protein [Lysobacter]ALN89198.1 hypothetical protein LG3211_0208 [Lysobacter gummosus]UJB18865.1 hypothetical protein L1A79_21525 [Lysobacter capsici]UJQ27410.1 hypothetical protein L2D09_18360 [Lysobacter gummosus]UNP29887.1 hypothetical protein MOV92_00950 [Lysobacter gummosus]